MLVTCREHAWHFFQGAYQRTILCAHCDFEGTAWVTYDTCYRRQAAAKKSLDWSQVDFNLYNQTFAGRAKVKSRCKYCLSEYHRAEDCDYAPEPHFINATLHQQGEFNNTRRSLGEASPVHPPWSSCSQTGSRTNFSKSVSYSIMKKGTCADLKNANICTCVLTRDATVHIRSQNAPPETQGYANAHTPHHLD